MDLSGEDAELIAEEKEEQTYMENDAVRRNQTAVSSSSFFLPENLPGDIIKKRRGDKASANESLVFAPG